MLYKQTTQINQVLYLTRQFPTIATISISSLILGLFLCADEASTRRRLPSYERIPVVATPGGPDQPPDNDNRGMPKVVFDVDGLVQPNLPDPHRSLKHHETAGRQTSKTQAGEAGETRGEAESEASSSHVIDSNSNSSSSKVSHETRKAQVEASEAGETRGENSSSHHSSSDSSSASSSSLTSVYFKYDIDISQEHDVHVDVSAVASDSDSESSCSAYSSEGKHNDGNETQRNINADADAFFNECWEGPQGVIFQKVAEDLGISKASGSATKSKMEDEPIGNVNHQDQAAQPEIVQPLNQNPASKAPNKEVKPSSEPNGDVHKLEPTTITTTTDDNKKILHPDPHPERDKTQSKGSSRLPSEDQDGDKKKEHNHALNKKNLDLEVVSGRMTNPDTLEDVLILLERGKMMYTRLLSGELKEKLDDGTDGDLYQIKTQMDIALEVCDSATRRWINKLRRGRQHCQRRKPKFKIVKRKITEDWMEDLGRALNAFREEFDGLPAIDVTKTNAAQRLLEFFQYLLKRQQQIIKNAKGKKVFQDRQQKHEASAKKLKEMMGGDGRRRLMHIGNDWSQMQRLLVAENEFA